MNFDAIVTSMRDFVWDYILLYGLMFTGLFLTVRLGFPQFSRLFPAMGRMISDIKNKVPALEGGLTPFQSLATAVAAQVGTGNIVGVATAITAGGPGSAFWMLISGFLGMSTIFTEATLAQVYRERDTDGELVGGPAYYIKNGLKQKWLANLFAVLCIFALGVVGIMVQSNSIITSMNSAFGLNQVIVLVGLIAIVTWVLIGGMDRIGAFSEKVVPVMAFAYVGAGFVVLFLNLHLFIPVLQLIFTSAFTPEAVGGGVLGVTIQQAMKYGLSRGLFSNEAGMGSTPHSHAVATTKHPAEQGFVAMVGVFICTFVICITTVMINLLSESYTTDMVATWATANDGATYAQIMTQKGFFNEFGHIGEGFLSVSLSSFALTTIVGWYFFAESNVRFLIKNAQVVSRFKLVGIVSIILGYFAGAGIIWTLADLAMGMMAIPNIIALVLLSSKAKSVLKDYDQQMKLDAEHLRWDFKYENINTIGEGAEHKVVTPKPAFEGGTLDEHMA